MPKTIGREFAQEQDFFTTGLGGHLRVNVEYQTTATDDDVQRVINHLIRNGWQTAEQIADALIYGCGEAGKRKVRAIAEQADGRIISGQRGYYVTYLASIDERKHAANWYRSQAEKMTRRADRIESIGGSV